MKYVYVIEKAEDGSVSAYVVDEVRRSIKNAVASYIDSLRQHNEPVPPPNSTVDVVEAA